MNNLLVITVDCMRADYLKEEITPKLCNLGKQGTVYSRAYANGCGTPDSFPAIMASRVNSPFAHKPEVKPHEGYALTNKDIVLAEVLHAQGYETAAFVAGNPYLGAPYGYHRGFQIYQDNQPGSLVNKVTGHRLQGALRKMAYRLPWSPYPRGEVVTQSCIQWLERHDETNGRGKRAFFAWVHYMDAHFPTLPPGQWSLSERRAAWSPIKGDAGKHREVLKYMYEEALKYIDHQIGQLLRVIPQNTVVVLTADHGQLFGEHDSFHHNGVWEELLRVPLIVYPAEESPAEQSDPVQLLDLAPQLLNILGAEIPPEWQGSSLQPPEDPIYAVSNLPPEHTYSEAWIYRDRKVIKTPEKIWELFSMDEESALSLSKIG
jgi:arylsulfatase A-like enzyme